MVLSYKTSSNKLLCTFVSKWSKQMATLRQISSMVQPSSRKLTLSEYLKNIVVSQSVVKDSTAHPAVRQGASPAYGSASCGRVMAVAHRSGFAQVLNDRIEKLNSSSTYPPLQVWDSNESFKNYILNSKNISKTHNFFLPSPSAPRSYGGIGVGTGGRGIGRA